MIEIEGYRDLVRIGAGGLGDVYRAVRVSTGSTVAIKVLRDISDGSVAWHRTRRELTALVSLSGHAHVIGVLELLDLPSGPALVMEYAPGGSVAGLLARRDGRLTVAEAVLVGRHTASALVAAHALGIVHRDLKPQNLLIDGFGQVKLCDFGIASLARSEEFRTRTNALSMRYASPEDLEEDVEVEASADVYSLGATLLHLVHGAPPTLRERLAPWQPPTDASPLDDVLAQCLRPEPGERPTAAMMLERLDALDWDLADRCRALEVVTPVVDHGEADHSHQDHDEGGHDEGGHDVPAADAADMPPLDDDTSSATVLRPDRPAPPLPPRPAATSKRRPRWPIGIAAAIAIGSIALVWWLAGGETPDEVTTPTTSATVSSSSPSTSPATTPATSRDGSTPQVSIVSRDDRLGPLDDDTVWPFGVVGGCLVQVNGLDELMEVDCGEPHDLQRFAVDELDPTDFPPDAGFDAPAVAEATGDACRRAFSQFVGVDPDASELAIAVTRPSADTWAEGDRRFQCLLGVEDAWLVGDAAGSEQ